MSINQLINDLEKTVHTGVNSQKINKLAFAQSQKLAPGSVCFCQQTIIKIKPTNVKIKRKVRK